MTDRDRMDPRLAAGLEDVFTALIAHDTARPAQSTSQQPAAHGRRSIWVTAAVGVLVALLAVVTIRAVGDRQHTDSPAATLTAPTPAPAVTSTTLLSHLPTQPYGTVVHTWTDQHPDGSGPFDVAGSTVVIAGVCEGGGKISWTDVTGKANTLNCAKRTVQSPNWRFNPGRDFQPTTQAGPTRLSVRVLAGAPRFIVRAWKVDPRTLRDGWVIAATSSSVPKTLRTCASGDLAPTGTFRRLQDFQGGVVTITNRSSTDCAIRSWPAMAYLDASGHQIGPVEGGSSENGKSLDSREGAVNKYKEFPPARLAAGDHGYLIAELFTRDRLEQDDHTTTAHAATPAPGSSITPPPSPVCHPVTVASIRFTIAGSTVVVPVPGTPATAACQSDDFGFGVDPVVTTDPGTR